MPDHAETLLTIESLLKRPTTDARVAEALNMSLSLAETANGDAVSLTKLGALLVAHQQAATAVGILERAAALAPDAADPADQLGRALSDLDRFDEATPHFKRALDLRTVNGKVTLSPDNVDAIGHLGTAALYAGDYAGADQYMTAVVAMYGDMQTIQSPLQAVDTEALPPLSSRRVHRLLYLPVEVKAREFQSKLLLALCAAKYGVSSVVGRSWTLNAGSYQDLPPGLILFKTLNGIDGHNMAVARKDGRHLIAALDEEAFGRSVNERVLRLNLDPQAVAATDLILLQGEMHRKNIRGLFPDTHTRLAVTGNPKTDLFPALPGLSTAEKGHILICLMSGNINNGGRSFNRTINTTLGMTAATGGANMVKALAGLMYDAVRFEIAMVPQLIEVIETTARAFPERTIIVRPHPIERDVLWRDKFTHLSNVRIEAGGSLVEWLKDAAAMVYVAGCGSGLEAYLYGIPSVCFLGNGTVTDPDSGISNRLNTPAETATQTVDTLRHLLAEGLDAEARRETDTVLADYLYRPKDQTASDCAAQTLCTFLQERLLDTPAPTDQLLSLGTARLMKAKLHPFHLRKFPETPVSEVQQRIADLAGQFNLPADVNVDAIDDGLFLIRPG